MKVLAKFGRVVAGAIVIVTVGFSSTVGASELSMDTSSRDPQLELQQCIDSCYAFYGEPGPALKKCVQDCLKVSHIPSFVVEARCETYENCEDDGGL